MDSTSTETGRVFVKPPQVACHDMFKLMDRQSLIEGLHPKGDSPPTLDAGTIEFEDVKFFYPFRPEIQVALKKRPGTFKKKKTMEKQHPYEYTRKHLKLRNYLFTLETFFHAWETIRSSFWGAKVGLFSGRELLVYWRVGFCRGGGFSKGVEWCIISDMVWCTNSLDSTPIY